MSVSVIQAVPAYPFKCDAKQLDFLAIVPFFLKKENQIEVSKKLCSILDGELIKMAKAPLGNNVISDSNAISAFPTTDNRDKYQKSATYTESYVFLG